MNLVTADIWSVDLKVSPEILAVYFAELNKEEKDRSERFRYTADRTNFIVSRAVLKRLISSRLSLPISEIDFKKNRFGKPRLKSNRPLEFNLSHSGNLALIGITENYRIGIDVEFMKDGLDYLNIAKHHFAPQEYQLLSGQTGSGVKEYFYRCWTRKESFIKAEGSGVSYPLDSFVVSMDSSDTARIISFQNTSEELENWSMHTFCPKEQYQAAVSINYAQSFLEQKVWDHSAILK